MITLFTSIRSHQELYEPESVDDIAEYEINRQKLAVWVGLIALLLPIVLLLYGLVSGTPLKNSISHYYYDKYMGGVFVIALAFIGTFLIAYKGRTYLETKLASISGCFTYGIAYFPTCGPGFEVGEISSRVFAKVAIQDGIFLINQSGQDSAFIFFRNAQILHYLSAGILFFFLAYYCFFIFTSKLNNVNYAADGYTSNKRIRNLIYYTAGSIIIVCILFLLTQKLWGDEWDKGNYTLKFEAIALITFGFAWMVKGRFWGLALTDEYHTQESIQLV